MEKNKEKKKRCGEKETHTAAKQLGRGVRIKSQTKIVVENVRKFFESEKTKGHRRAVNVVQRTAQATGLSIRSVKRIHQEYVSHDCKFLTPVKRYSVSRIRVNPDSFDRAVIKRLVHGFYRRKEYPNITGVLEKAKAECSFPGGRFCMWRLLKELGFYYKKRDRRRYVLEQQHVIAQRHKYLQAIRKLRRDNDYDIIYTDETWVNSHHTNDYIWLDKDGSGGWKVPSGKGTRLIVVHAGDVEGWVDGADLVFLSKTNSADYHDEMNSEHYMEWLTEQLLPRLERPTVIVIDNVSYHNKQVDKAPTTNDKKADIQKWLDDHKVQYSHTDIKKTLLELVKQYRPTPHYLTDDAIHTAGHTVLRLPVAHCELNPIELAWASVKGYVAKHNKEFTMTETKQLTEDGFTHTTTDMWRSFCRHVVDVEYEYFENDGVMEDMVEEMVIDTADDSDDSDDEEEEDLIDDDDRQLLDRLLEQGNSTYSDQPSTSAANIMLNPRRDLTEQFKDQFDKQFLEDVLPLP